MYFGTFIPHIETVVKNMYLHHCSLDFIVLFELITEIEKINTNKIDDITIRKFEFFFILSLFPF